MGNIFCRSIFSSFASNVVWSQKSSLPRLARSASRSHGDNLQFAICAGSSITNCVSKIICSTKSHSPWLNHQVGHGLYCHFGAYGLILGPLLQKPASWKAAAIANNSTSRLSSASASASSSVCLSTVLGVRWECSRAGSRLDTRTCLPSRLRAARY